MIEVLVEIATLCIIVLSIDQAVKARKIMDRCEERQKKWKKQDG